MIRAGKSNLLGNDNFGVMAARKPLPSTISMLFIAKDSEANTDIIADKSVGHSPSLPQLFTERR